MNPDEMSAIPKNLTQVNKLAAPTASESAGPCPATSLPQHQLQVSESPSPPFLLDSALVGPSHSHGHRSLATDMLLNV